MSPTDERGILMGPIKELTESFTVGIDSTFAAIQPPERARAAVLASLRAAIHDLREKYRTSQGIRPSNSIGDEPLVPIDQYDGALADLSVVCDPLAAVALYHYLMGQAVEQRNAQIVSDAILAGLLDPTHGKSASTAVGGLVQQRLLRPSQRWIGRLLLNLAARFGRYMNR